MSEKSGKGKLKEITKTNKSKPAEITDPDIILMNEVIQGYAPELGRLYPTIEDTTEEQRIKTGHLHENRILGVLLNFFLNGNRKMTTTEVK
ncbi:hypothetical protein LCGC14_0900050 [marine sediment metagenome]|uniref:Uncharacterized protein n=1 Tax=marine sediment metagenome TaxID=412755 RepID=A0A0F9PHG0_9ZZZZ